MKQVNLDKTIIIKYKNIRYSVDTNKTLNIISALSDCRDLIECKTEDEFRKLLKQYKLLDEVFLEKVSVSSAACN